MEAELPQQVEGRGCVHLGTFCWAQGLLWGAKVEVSEVPKAGGHAWADHRLPGMDEVLGMCSLDQAGARYQGAPTSTS